MTHGIFTYTGTANLGDAVQTVALSRLLPAGAVGVDRNGGRISSGVKMVANGWLGNNRIPRRGARASTIFAGVFVAQDHNLEWLRASPSVIGARDPSTAERLTGLGLTTEMIGCATLTLPRYRGVRSGTYAVDSGPAAALPKSTTVLTHRIAADMPWERQWRAALAVLDIYRTAALVHTGRLHVALPCLAYGTPVVFHQPDSVTICDPMLRERISLLSFLDVRDGVAAEPDPVPLANRYRDFLQRTLGIDCQEHDPVQPL